MKVFILEDDSLRIEEFCRVTSGCEVTICTDVDRAMRAWVVTLPVLFYFIRD